MRRFIFSILLAAVSCVTFATGSDSLYFPDGMKWSYLILQSLQTPDDYMYWEEEIHGDTTINGVVYRNIGSYYGYVREEGGRVYMPNPQPYPQPTDPAELLLFDFNMNVGDSIQATHYGVGFEIWQKVVAVDTVELLNHVKARRLIFDDGDVDIEFICNPYTKLLKRAHGALPEVTSYYEYMDLCCSLDDELLYEFTPQGCSFVDEQPIDTISSQPADTIPSLCDAWNVLVEDGVGCDDCAIYTQEYRLKGDTTIAEMNYKKMLLADNYQGALREGNNRDIYFIPAASSHEYLLYAFNAQVGDTLNNVWIGGPLTWYPEGWIVTVTEIHDTNPRIFTLETIIQYDYDYSKVWQVGWIEGVGMSDGPFGTPLRCIGCADGRGIGLLCAYKNGERVYTTPMAESFGCWYSNEQTADTIPLYRYTGDGPDGSTVDPVDPNQVVVILQGDELTIREFIGEDITYNLEIRTQNNAPAQAQAPARNYGSQTFREYVAIQLTEDGSYTLQLTNPEWGYGMVATFNYGRNALPFTSVDAANAPQKILRDGQLLIRQGERLFTPTGMQVE